MLVDNALARVKQRPQIQYETNHVVGALGLVSAGVGMAVLPELALSKTTAPRMVAIELSNPVITRTLGVIVRKGLRLAPAARALAEMIEKAVKAGR